MGGTGVLSVTREFSPPPTAGVTVTLARTVGTFTRTDYKYNG